MTAVIANEAVVTIRSGPLVGAILTRVVGMLAARAQCPIDRLDDALMITDAIAAHAPDHAINGNVLVRVRADEQGLELCVGGLRDHGAQALLDAAALPGVGNVLERIADAVDPEPASGDQGEQLVIRLRFKR
jgi:serine/threonine-protein kinase RsbW